VRESGDPPDFHRFTPEELEAGVVEHARILAREMTTVAVIADDSRVDALRAELEDDGVTVLPASLAKGLEFDAVILVEPAEITAREPHGIRMLFVALTRAVQHLAIAHAAELPDELAATA
jgi:DNA helicase IV